MVSATSLEMHAVSMSIVCYNLNLFLFEQNMIKNKIKSRYTQGTRPWVQSSRIAMATSCRKCSITLAAASPPGWPSTRPFWQAWREPDPCMSTTSLPNATRGFSSSRWFSVATTTSFVSESSLSLSPRRHKSPFSIVLHPAPRKKETGPGMSWFCTLTCDRCPFTAFLSYPLEFSRHQIYLTSMKNQ